MGNRPGGKMKTTTRRGSFAPIGLFMETRFEYDSIMLALRIGADGMRVMLPDTAINTNDSAACVDFARSLLENPEVEK